MAFIAFCMLFAMVGSMIWGLATKPQDRADFANEFKQAPFVWVFLICWIGCIGAFFFGIFIPPLGQLHISFGRRYLELWQIGGIGGVLGLVLYFAGSKHFR